jgi:hypothetical protein
LWSRNSTSPGVNQTSASESSSRILRRRVCRGCSDDLNSSNRSGGDSEHNSAASGNARSLCFRDQTNSHAVAETIKYSGHKRHRSFPNAASFKRSLGSNRYWERAFSTKSKASRTEVLKAPPRALTCTTSKARQTLDLKDHERWLGISGRPRRASIARIRFWLSFL